MATHVTARDQDLLRRLLAHAAASHESIDLDDPADYWYRFGRRNATAHAAGLLIAGDDPARADAIADRITRLLSDTGPAPAPALDELYAAAVAPFPPSPAHPAAPRLRWLEPRGWAATHRHDPEAMDHQYGSTWGPRRDTAILWRHHPNAAVGMLFAHDLTWDEYALLAESVDSRDVDAAYVAACRAQTPVTAEGFAGLLLQHQRTPRPQAGPTPPETDHAPDGARHASPGSAVPGPELGR